MSWSIIKAAFRDLVDAHDRGRPMAIAWRDFQECVRKSPTPVHLLPILTALRGQQGSHKPESVKILDHGCGSGLTLLYLHTLGYTNIYGVDIGGRCERWNAIVGQGGDCGGQRFVVCDGVRTPFSEASFDMIFSQEVLEHVRPDCLDAYYAEEVRLLRIGGAAFHRVPHRLCPFDSHTRTWFLHYLPRPLWLLALRAAGRDPTFPKEAIFLRWPWVHRRKVRQFIGPTRDLTLERLRGGTDLDIYEGSARLRRLVDNLIDLPIFGPILTSLFANIAAMDTLSNKR